MDYYVKSVIPVIESNYENFTALEKNIADFFFDSPSAMLGNLPKVLMNAEQLQQILNR